MIEGKDEMKYWQLIERHAGVTSQTTGEVISLPCYTLTDGKTTVGPFHQKQAAIDWANERWSPAQLVVQDGFVDVWLDMTDRPYGLPNGLAERELAKIHHVGVDGNLRVSRFNGKTMEWVAP